MPSPGGHVQGRLRCRYTTTYLSRLLWPTLPERTWRGIRGTQPGRRASLAPPQCDHYRFAHFFPIGLCFVSKSVAHVVEIPDPALREWSRYQKSTKTFGDILPSGYIAAAQPGIESPVSPSNKFFQAAIPKIRSVAEIVRRRATLPRPRFGGVSRSMSLIDERRGLLEDNTWEIIGKDELTDSRLGRSKSEMRPSRYYAHQ